MDTLPEFNISNIETSILNELLPRQLRLNAKTFVNLLEDYYRFLNQKDNPSYVIQRIIDEHDLDKVVDDRYLEKIKYEIARAIPTSTYVQRAFLLKRIIDSYGIRGNDESVLYFFRIFFNEDVTIYNPWEQVLIPSQGKWTQELKTRLILYCGDSNILINNTIAQYDAQNRILAQGDVENVVKRKFRDKFYFDVTFRKDSIKGIFTENSEVRTIDNHARGKLIRSLSKIRIKNKGSGYSVGDRFYLGGIENVSFYGEIDRVDINGEVTSIKTLTNGISNSIHYFDSIPNDPDILPNLSTIYINGELIKIDDAKYCVQTRFGDNTKNIFDLVIRNSNDQYLFDIHSGKQVDISGILTSNGIEVDLISDVIDENIVLHDFKYYNKLTTPEFESNGNFKTFDNVVIKTNKLYDAETTVEFDFLFSLVYLTDGFYDDEKGRPSGFSVLQDSFYYQVFSYEINSNLSIDQWKSIYEDLIHPTGFKVFNRINSSSLADLDYEFSTSVDKISPFLPTALESSEKFKIQSSVNVTTQTYNYSTNSPEPVTGIPRIPDIESSPYFAEDYTTTLELLFNLIYIDNSTEYNLIYNDGIANNDLIFTIGVGTNFGLSVQGLSEDDAYASPDPYDFSSDVILHEDGKQFSDGYYRRNDYPDTWILQE